MNERTIFTEALERETATERSAYLDAACAGDEAIRGRVEALLRSHDQAGTFLGKPVPERLGEGLAAEMAGDDTQTVPSAPEADDGLDFLEPSDKPGVLGRLGHYEVLEVLGRGGMGVVLRAFDEQLHRVVAIKVMAAQLATNGAARRRFTREARAAAAVSHDHVVTIHAVEDASPRPHIVMQYVAGASLQERLDRTGPLPLPEILRIGMQAAAGLAAAHAQGLVHRDVKPANILLENGVERVKLTDFGLARAADDASLTQSGAVAGTPSFMSPEQAEGRPVEQRSDLFSLGSALYAMCTGRPPFRAGTNIGVLKRVCEETPTPIRETNPEVPDWLAAVVEKLHAKDPAGRFQTAAEVAELLGQYLAHVQHPSAVALPAVVTPAAAPPPSGRAARHHRWAVAAAVLVALFAVLGTTEATGVTNVRATVTRILTPDGTLVVETDDPDVKVTVEGDGGLVVTGAGLQEIRLKPGSYRVLADRDGKRVPLDRELVTVSRRGREIVRVKLEASSGLSTATAEKGAFVLLGGKGVAEREFDTLAEAVQVAIGGDIIEIRGNGPFISDPVTISNRLALTIRAGHGYRPVLRLSRGAVEDQTHLLSTNSPLVLEGLEIRCERRPTAKDSLGFVTISVSDGPLHVANCRFVASFRHALYVDGGRRAVVTNCEFLGSPTWSDALTGRPAPGGVWELENCVQNCGGTAVSCGIISPDVRERAVRIRRCSLVGCLPFYFYFYATPKDPESGQTARALRVEVSGSLLAGQLAGVFWAPEAMNQSHTPPAVKPEDALSHLIGWRGSDNVHHRVGDGPAGRGDAMIHLQAGTQNQALWRVNDLATWRKFWGSPETGSVQGEIRYHGGDLATRVTEGADKLTPEDFRLRADSAGYRAGKDGNDLGADVDLVGPGAAYERWKKTPEYQQWLKESGQKK